MLPLALAAVLAPLAAQTSALDKLVQSADRIAVARVETIRPVKLSAQQAAECSVSKVLYGPEDEALVLFPAVISSTTLEAGKTYLFFLQRSTGSPLTTAQERQIAPALKGAPLYLGTAVWRVEEGQAIVTAGTLPKAEGPAGAASGPGGDHVALEELEGWLARRIDASLPSIRVENVTIAPKTWSFTIGPEGTIHGTGAAKERMESAELKELWEAIEKERFDELPEVVGSAQMPDQAGGQIEVRTKKGRRVVVILGDRVDGSSPEEREATERALRLWNVLPVAEPGFGKAKK